MFIRWTAIFSSHPLMMGKLIFECLIAHNTDLPRHETWFEIERSWWSYNVVGLPMLRINIEREWVWTHTSMDFLESHKVNIGLLNGYHKSGSGQGKILQGQEKIGSGKKIAFWRKVNKKWNYNTANLITLKATEGRKKDFTVIWKLVSLTKKANSLRTF